MTDAAEAVTPPQNKQKRDTRAELISAAELCVHRGGYADLSTRRVAEIAGVPLSQIHYHFGSKERLFLALLDHLNEGLLKRQAETFAAPMPLWQRWERACDFLDDDLASGYVRILHEMIAASLSSPEIAKAVRRDLRGWFELLDGLAQEAERRFGGLGPFSAAEVTSLVSAAFLGSETMILLEIESPHVPVRQALRRFGETIRRMEEAAPGS
ncbi:TetR/AcrR family transcriptional regulator [Mesorhizobium sp. M1143]|uniref:TetR/AcrR family transcriptional regulator n=1 Tax=Mesorhizobium sp. M1143 TaxID=2957061 RepID=UPI0033357282